MALCLLAQAAGLLIPAAATAAGDATLISRASGVSGQAANGIATKPAVSDNGRFIAFESTATNLDPLDLTPDRDIYVRDLTSNETILASRASGLGAPKADGDSTSPSISADGRFIAFASSAQNLAGGAPAGPTQVYLRDLVTEETILVSRQTGAAGAPADGLSDRPSISADGGLVAFASRAPNLTGAQDTQEVFVRDIAAATTTLVSRRSGVEGASAARESAAPAISANGSRVAFQSNSSVLSDGQTRGGVTWVRDLAATTTVLASRADGPNGRHAGGFSPNTSISGDGRLVPFVASRGRVDQRPRGNQLEVYLRNTVTDRTRLISRGIHGGERDNQLHSTLPSISADGRYVSFSVGTEDGRPKPQTQGLFIRAIAKGKTERLLKSPAAGTPSTLRSVMSANGRRIAFQSDSRRLDPEDEDRQMDIFVTRRSR